MQSFSSIQYSRAMTALALRNPAPKPAHTIVRSHDWHHRFEPRIIDAAGTPAVFDDLPVPLEPKYLNRGGKRRR